MVSQELRAILPLSASSVESGLCRRLHNCSVGWRLGVYAGEDNCRLKAKGQLRLGQMNIAVADGR